MRKNRYSFSAWKWPKNNSFRRLLCMEGRINSRKLRTGFLAGREFPKLQQAADRLSPAPIHIDETPNVNVLEIRSKARRHKSQHGLDLLIIDYMQLMSGGMGRVENRQVEIAQISRSIKGLARELSVPVLALSQLSREAEKDDDGIPKLQHLRESGAIEQDADVVLMLSRPPAHRRGDPDDAGDVSSDNTVHLTIAKQRNGPTGRLELLFDRDIQRFMDLASGPRNEPGPRAGHMEEDYEPAEAFDDDDVPF